MLSEAPSCFLQRYYLFYWRSFVRDNFLSLLDRSNRESLVLVVYLLDFLYGVLNPATCAHCAAAYDAYAVNRPPAKVRSVMIFLVARMEYPGSSRRAPALQSSKLVCLWVRESLRVMGRMMNVMILVAIGLGALQEREQFYAKFVIT